MFTEYSGLKFSFAILAHEFGHLIGLSHAVAEDNAAEFGCTVMCPIAQNEYAGFWFHREEAEAIADAMTVKAHHLTARMGNIMPELEILASVTINNELSVEESQGSAEFLLSLVDKDGNPAHLEKAISLEVYTKHITTTDFDISKIMKRVTFDAGVSELSVDVDLVNDDFIEDNERFEFGIRFGDSVLASQTIGVEVTSEDAPAVPAVPAAPTKSKSGDKSGGGSLGWLSLFALVLVRLYRK